MVGEGQIYGQLDVPLKDGYAQEIAAVIDQLPASFDAVYSSPSSRCTQLALAITPSFKTDKALYEFHFGDWEGQTWGAVAGPVCDQWMNDFVNCTTPNGESMIQMQARVICFLEEILVKPYEKVALITHAGVIRILLAHYRSVHLKDAFEIKVGMGEVVKLRVSRL